MNYIWTWIILTILTDAITILIRCTVFVAFSECRLVKKYFVEPTDKVWALLSREVDELSDKADRGDQRAAKEYKQITGILIGLMVLYYAVPFGAIVLGLIVDPILCYGIATDRIRID